MDGMQRFFSEAEESGFLDCAFTVVVPGEDGEGYESRTFMYGSGDRLLEAIEALRDHILAQAKGAAQA
jgi:hypothetical protein